MSDSCPDEATPPKAEPQGKPEPRWTQPTPVPNLQEPKSIPAPVLPQRQSIRGDSREIPGLLFRILWLAGVPNDQRNEGGGAVDKAVGCRMR